MLPVRPLSKQQQEAAKDLQQYRAEHPRPVSPCINQTSADIAAYYRAAVAGMAAAIRHTQYGTLQYRIAEVEWFEPRTGRVHVKNHGAFYAKTGNNCFHPKGQTSLVVPTPEVLAWAAEHPQGEAGVQWWKDSGGGIL